MKSLVAVLAALAMTLFASACTSPAGTSGDGHTDHTHGAESSSAPDQPADFNDADVSFATMMIPHHEQAVALSDLVPERSSDPALVELAAAISAAQEPEIETMKGFLTTWTGSAGGGHEGHEGHDMGGHDMQGMVDEETMKRLESLKGEEFDTLWLQSMIAHHEGAIAMANTELTDGFNADAKALAEEIVSTQQAEITQMKDMLGG